MSEPTSIKNLRDLVSPTTLGTFHVEPAAVLSAYDTMKMRAEAAEAERESVSSQLWDCMNEREALRVERDALRTVDDAMVERAARSLHASSESVFTHSTRIAWKNCGEHWHKKLRGAAKEAITAALAVQPTTGEAK